MWHVAKRLIAAGYSQADAITELYNVWRPPFDFSRVRWAVLDAAEETPEDSYCWECGGSIEPEHETKRLTNGAIAHTEHYIPGLQNH